MAWTQQKGASLAIISNKITKCIGQAAWFKELYATVYINKCLMAFFGGGGVYCDCNDVTGADAISVPFTYENRIMWDILHKHSHAMTLDAIRIIPFEQTKYLSLCVRAHCTVAGYKSASCWNTFVNINSIQSL